MLLLAPARVADGLRDGTLSERTRFQLFILGTVLSTLSGRSAAAFRNNGELLLAVIFVAVTLLGLFSCYNANGGAAGRGFIERYACLVVPVGIRVYGAYYLLYYCAYIVFRRGGGVPPQGFIVSQWLPAGTALVAMLVFYWVLRGYIRRSASVAG